MRKKRPKDTRSLTHPRKMLEFESGPYLYDIHIRRGKGSHKLIICVSGTVKRGEGV